nr:testis-expressed protein 9 [Anolis sagrei ordinatus]
MAAVKGGKKGLGLGLGLGAFLAKEEEYKRLNAALEAQAAELVRQAEEAMRDQQEALSRPLSTQLELLEEEAEAQRQRGLLSPGSSAPPPRQPLNKKKSSSAPAAGKERRPLPSAKPRPRHVPLAADDVAVPDFSLAKTIGRIEGQLEEGGGLPEVPEDLIPGGGSQLGELEGLKRAQKQASVGQSSMEVRLNRALEEAEKGKAELNRIKQAKKDLASQEQKKLEELKAENKRLAKQKEELMAAFKKQLKLIDILKRQKASGPKGPPPLSHCLSFCIISYLFECSLCFNLCLR